MTDSKTVAEVFGKRHDHVLRDIENLDVPEDFRAPNFGESKYKVNSGRNTVREHPMYLMTRQGFTILAMGFTGAKAMRWKIKYMEAFEEMSSQQTLKSSG